MASRLPVPEILDRISAGHEVTDAQIESAASAAASLRLSFMNEFFSGINNLTPHTGEFESFKRCLKGMVDLLMKNGIVGVQDAQAIWMRVEEMER
jgi:hypothetical protein